MLDSVAARIDHAAAHNVVVASCCFTGCRKDAAVLIVLKLTDGRTDVYGACRKDLQKIKAGTEISLERTSRQSAFFYP